MLLSYVLRTLLKKVAYNVRNLSSRLLVAEEALEEEGILTTGQAGEDLNK